jgi:hypothetical protein
VLPNGYDEEDFRFPSEPPQDTFCLTYAGTITDTYNINLPAGLCRKCPPLFRNKFQASVCGKSIGGSSKTN